MDLLCCLVSNSMVSVIDRRKLSLLAIKRKRERERERCSVSQTLYDTECKCRHFMKWESGRMLGEASAMSRTKTRRSTTRNRTVAASKIIASYHSNQRISVVSQTVSGKGLRFGQRKQRIRELSHPGPRTREQLVGCCFWYPGIR